jgi:hypothetical protein
MSRWVVYGLCPAATPAAAFPQAPMDRRRGRATTGVIVHPRVLEPLFDRPGGVVFAASPSTLLGYDTWLSVIAYQTGWVRVLLPSRPAGVSGWLDADRVSTALTLAEVRIYLRAGRLHLLHGGRTTGAWRTMPNGLRPTIPSGRSFLLAVRRDPRFRDDVPVVKPAFL